MDKFLTCVKNFPHGRIDSERTSVAGMGERVPTQTRADIRVMFGRLNLLKADDGCLASQDRSALDDG